ncbi:MAG TPA: hypothetical protein VNY27_01155 [Solirubrobacteraceae bacterium]|nr:hypothetical protein [Solirubrobacteraceae bacterium]
MRTPACPDGRGRTRVLRAAALALALAALIMPVTATRAGAFGVSLQTGIATSPPFGSNGEVELARTQAIGAQFLKLAVDWSEVAPMSPPPGFEPANPNDPTYRWAPLDATISAIVAHGLTPVIDIAEPPAWAQSPPGSGQTRPDPNQLALFAHAVASRYDGTQPGLPRVAYWEVWNEPNASFFLQSQTRGGNVVSVDTYRTMINDFASAVHGVHSDNVVIGGALFPNAVRRPGVTAIAPLDFTRRLFCLSTGTKPRRVCQTAVNVDVWSVHPYTSGGPSTRPANPDNVWIANLTSLTTLVHAAQRVGTLVSMSPAQVWVTEFGWNSNPPDHTGVSVGLERRWVAETLYRAWEAGIEVFTWFKLNDEPANASPFQTGLYFACTDGTSSCDTPKPAAAAFRFPFVAYTSGKRRVLVWGRTPAGTRGRVRIEWLQGHRWHTFATFKTDGDGIFTGYLWLPLQANSTSAQLRATQAGAGAAPAFSLRRPPDILVTPFAP